VREKIGLALGLGWILIALLFGLLSAVVLVSDSTESSWSEFLAYGVCYGVGLGVQGFIAGLVVGALLDRVPSIRIGPMFVIRHLIAFASSGAMLILAIEAIDRVWGWGEGLWGPGAVCICGLWTLVWVDCIMVPVAVVGEAAVMNKEWSNLAIAAAVGLLTSIVPFPLYLVWGVTYWSVFTVVTAVVRRFASCSKIMS
jgi:hypothetical protein